MPYKCTKFQLDWSTSLWVTVIFSSVQKDKEEKNKKKMKKNARKFVLLYLGNTLHDFLQIWCVVLVGRHLHSNFGVLLDKRTWSYECGKIATLLFLLICSHNLRAPCFLGLHDTLPCVLIYSNAILRECDRLVIHFNKAIFK